ncbi:hypothetical protein OG559_31115 (plasmid) [Micromonospora sp. NBC_01405]|uniref:hypothetical protein n=1 Tax=Micromonospora sp. NBC_01405 TaxID=2903589 RepID=UPI0032491D4D
MTQDEVKREAVDGQGPVAVDGQGPAAVDGQGPAAVDGQGPGTIGAQIPPELLAALMAIAQRDQAAALPVAGPEPEPARARLVLATGRTVEAENTNSTHHYDPEAGVTVPVLSAYTV